MTLIGEMLSTSYECEHIAKYSLWPGLAVARWSRLSINVLYSTPGPVSTWMGDRL